MAGVPVEGALRCHEMIGLVIAMPPLSLSFGVLASTTAFDDVLFMAS